MCEKLWSIIANPFRMSIRVRFHIALLTALIGISLMGAIATVSSRFLLDTFERNVAEATREVGPSHHLEIMLREAERLAHLYAINSDAPTLSKFQQIANKVDGQFRVLSRYISRHVADRHADDIEKIERARSLWQDARLAILAAPQAPNATIDLADSHTQGNITIVSAYQLISEFHHHAMEEMREHLLSGRRLARWTHYTTYISIFIGFGLLTVMVLFVSRSLLVPIGQLLEAADRFGKKDLAYRVQLRNSQDELGQLAYAFNSAAASLQHLYKELERRSTHDGLTGVLNRAAFDDRLRSECKSADRHKRPLSLLMVDIDFFKRVNDDHGHQTGDKVLQSVARILNAETRPDDVVARYGGEEFGVILPETNEHNAVAMADRLRKAVEVTNFECGATEGLNITLSLGCTTRQPNTSIAADFVKTADEALYQAKANGRNRACVGQPLLIEHRILPQIIAA